MLLLLMRHAEAAPLGSGHTDETRPLTRWGHSQVKLIGDELRRRSVEVKAVVTSPYMRARQTGNLLAEHLEVPVVESSPILGSRGIAPKIEPLVEQYVSSKCLVLVGHQPDMSLLATALCGASVPFSPATVAVFDWSDPDEARFLWSISPNDLPG